MIAIFTTQLFQGMGKLIQHFYLPLLQLQHILLRKAPNLRVLAMSRELLGIPTKPRIGLSAQEGLSRLKVVCW